MKTNAGQSFGFPLLRNITPGHARPAQNLKRHAADSNAGLGSNRLGERSARLVPHRESSFVALGAGEISNVTILFRASRIQVESGIVWLTGDPADGDVILGAGESFELKGEWIYVVQALDEASFIVWH